MEWSDHSQEDVDEALAVMQEGMREWEAGRCDEAEDILKRALNLCPVPGIINNLATVYLHTGRVEEALAVLEPNLLGEAPNPYAHATASQCLFALGKPDEALAAAETAVDDFEAGRPTRPGWMMRSEEAGWYDYVGPILKALGDLGEHRRVWQLYGSWQVGIQEPTAHYYAGIAAFNLGQFLRAEKAWNRVKDRDWGLLASFRHVARLCATDGLPVPPLGYAVPSPDAKDIDGAAGDERDWERIIQWFVKYPVNLMLPLSMMYSDDVEEGWAVGARQFVQYGGDWGEEFGRHVLQCSRASKRLKMSTLSGLADRGLVDLETPVEVMVDGEMQEVILQEIEIEISAQPTQHERELHEQLLPLLDGEELEKLREELEQIIYADGATWAELILLYGITLRRMGELDEAHTWFKMLDDQLPGHPVVQIEFARLHVAWGEYDEARRILQGFSLEKLPSEAREEIEMIRDELLMYLRLTELPEILTGEKLPEELREEAEEKPIHPSRTTLRSALRKLPVQWLDGTCDLHGLQELPPRRQERERQLAEWLMHNPGCALDNIPESDPEIFWEGPDLLAFLLEEGGWAEKELVTAEFGADDHDVLFLPDDPPESALGQLRAAGLVFVGRTRLDGERRKVVAIPVDLREPLREALHLRDG